MSFVTDKLLSDCGNYTRQLDLLDQKFPFVGVIGSKFNHFIGHPFSSYNFLLMSHKHGQKNCLCENTSRCGKLNLYFDFDSKTEKLSDDHMRDVIANLKSSLSSFFPGLTLKVFVKDSSNSELSSFHFIVHLSTPEGHSVYIRDKEEMKQIFHLLQLQSPFDTALYNGFNIRMLSSNKFDSKQNKWADRHFRISPFSFSQNDILSLATHCPNEKFIMLDEYVKKQFVLNFVKDHGFTKNYSLDQVQKRGPTGVRDQDDHWSLMLTEQKCIEREHQSNNSVAMLYPDNITIKCLDDECSSFLHQFVQDNRFSITITDNNTNNSNISTNTQQSFCSGPAERSSAVPDNKSSTKKNKQLSEETLHIQKMVYECALFMGMKCAHELVSIKKLGPDYIHMIGLPSDNPALQLLLGQNPRDFIGNSQMIEQNFNGNITQIPFWQSIIDLFKKVTKEYTDKQLQKQHQVVYNNCQFVDNLQQQINNYYNESNSKPDDTVYDDFFNDLQFKSDKHRQYFTNITNGELQFVTEIYELEYPKQFLYVYDEKDNGQIMFFDNLDDSLQYETNGGFWNMQGGFKIAKSKIRDYIADLFNDIIQQLDPKDKRRKIVQYRLNQTRNDIYNNIRLDQHLSETYFNKKIKFNNFPNYIHFQNGTFDLDSRQFIKTTPNMYNTFQIDYDYDESVPYDEIYNQLSQIMPKQEFEWFLKQLSNCLNPNKVVQEKQIVILAGQGDNGKTILFNLMNETFCLDAYSINGRSQMIQAPNQTSSSATPDQAKLIYKRFCYIAELDKKLSFNQQQVKILTGGEKIQARDLYKSLITFQPSAGIFLSCNQIPQIDTSDGGFLNRLKIIDLKYQFVEEPQHQFQKQINIQLPQLVQTVQWKQGFMNLLIKYYYKRRQSLPTGIKKSIELRINLQQNPIDMWAQDHIKFQPDQISFSEDIRTQYNDDTGSNIGKICFNKQLNSYFQSQPQIFSNVEFKKITKNNQNTSGQAFTNCQLI